MKKRVLISTILAGILIFTGCGNSSEGNSNIVNFGGGLDDSNGTFKILTDTGSQVTVDPTGGATVIINRNNAVPSAVTVVRAHLNECNGVDTLGSRVACGPKSDVTYTFSTDFGALGPLDNLASTPDGGALLYAALTEYNGTKYVTPLEPNQVENRIHEVYIPSNYIVLDDMAKDDSVDEKYEYMKEYLANAFNMKLFIVEPPNNPYFINGKTTGKFVATYVMHFTRGTGESTLLEQFKTDTTNLEYLTVSFTLDVTQVDGNSSKLRFSSPANTPVVFGGKKAGGSSIQIVTTNLSLNSVLNVTDTVNSDNLVSMNVARYFDKVIAKGENLGVADYAKEILVENALNPWPVKIYGTLHEINSDASYQRSFVRNPAELNASLFNLDNLLSPYAGAYALTNGNTNQAMKFNIVYPGGVYNNLNP